MGQAEVISTVPVRAQWRGVRRATMVVPVIGALVIATAIGWAVVTGQNAVRGEALLQAGQEWQQRYEQVTGPLGRYTRAELAQIHAGRDWKQRYEQTTGPLGRFTRLQLAQIQAGRDWQQRYEQMSRSP
jgi:hypothetical protein